MGEGGLTASLRFAEKLQISESLSSVRYPTHSISTIVIIPSEGRANARKHSRLPVTVEKRVWSRASPYWICGNVFPPYTSVLSCGYHATHAPDSHFIHLPPTVCTRLQLGLRNTHVRLTNCCLSRYWLTINCILYSGLVHHWMSISQALQRLPRTDPISYC